MTVEFYSLVLSSSRNIIVDFLIQGRLEMLSTLPLWHFCFNDQLEYVVLKCFEPSYLEMDEIKLVGTLDTCNH